MDRYILASQSPRRRELLHLVLNEYEVIPAKGEEVVRSTNPAEVVQELSFQKAMEVAKKLRPGSLTPQNAESQSWLIFLHNFLFCLLRICVYCGIIITYIILFRRVESCVS